MLVSVCLINYNKYWHQDQPPTKYAVLQRDALQSLVFQTVMCKNQRKLYSHLQYPSFITVNQLYSSCTWQTNQVFLNWYEINTFESDCHY